MLSSALHGSRQIFDKIFVNVWFRKAYHFIAGGLLVALVVVLDRQWFSAFCLFWLGVFAVMSKRVSTAVLGLFLLNTLSSKFVTLGSAVIFVVGDGVATVVGSAFGDKKWPWHSKKTILGSLSFFICASLAMVGVLQLMIPSPPRNLLMFAILPSLIGCVAEALPFALRDIRDLSPDDNLLVILSSGVSLYFLTKFFHPHIPPGW